MFYDGRHKLKNKPNQKKKEGAADSEVSFQLCRMKSSFRYQTCLKGLAYQGQDVYVLILHS